MASAYLREELECSVCLRIYTDPVVLRCGHNYCHGCIKSVLDTQARTGVYTCPYCRVEFQERPALQRNLKLLKIVKHFLSTQPGQEQDVISCTYCESYVPAAKTCLRCDASLCESHLKKHSKSEEHILVEPTTPLKSRKCAIHKEPLKYYCNEDYSCVCVFCCLAGAHKGHEVESLNEASAKKKDTLRSSMEKLISKREEKGKRVTFLQGHRREAQEAASDLTEKVTALFREIRGNLEFLEDEIQRLITRQEEHAALHITELIRHLEIQKDELSRKILDIDKICNNTDPLTLLQEFSKEEQHLHDICHSDNEGDNDITLTDYLDKAAISLILNKGLSSIADKMLDPKIKLPLVKTSNISLDIKTASNYIVVSNDLKSASYSSKDQQRPDVPERFEVCQVLSNSGLSSGRHYWEVNVSKAKRWIIGVASQSIERKVLGNESYIGYNDKSWSLEHHPGLVARHNDKMQDIVLEAPVKYLGIYLNYDSGQLSFYQVRDPIRHLHTFTATFTEPLFAAFHVFPDCCIKIRS
ncbi:E3 ubiquitin/ISG15 ligase TRIM25-like [Rhinophrynus dorsalis]